MKISELKNAPEWLVLAKTENEDVEITPSGFVIWKSGNFRGGDFPGRLLGRQLPGRKTSWAV